MSSRKRSRLEENCEQVTKTDHTLTETDGSLKLHPPEKRLIDFSDKLYLAPLTDYCWKSSFSFSKALQGVRC